jgi:carboxylesterase
MTANNQSNPAPDYAEAAVRIQALQALDTEAINPVSRTAFCGHGQKTGRAILFLHGYTNSPWQFHRLGDLFFEKGYNVLIPRAPHHGLQNRLTEELSGLDSAKLLAFLNESLDIARGLAEEVTVVGFSMGGVLALWAALHRADVSLSVAISPALAFHAIPLRMTGVIAKTMLALPNQFMWWDDKLKDTPLPPLHAYPRYASHGLAHFVDLGQRILRASKTEKPRAARVKFILNPADESVDNRLGLDIYANWRKLGAQSVEKYEFDPKLSLSHDLVDPEQPNQQTATVYPILMDEIAGVESPA